MGAMTEEILKTKPIGRTLRLLGGVALLIIDLPVLLRASWTYTLTSLGIVLALTLFYIMMHYLISRYTPTLNRWLGALLALTPVFLVFIFGQGGGPEDRQHARWDGRHDLFNNARGDHWNRIDGRCGCWCEKIFLGSY